MTGPGGAGLGRGLEFLRTLVTLHWPPVAADLEIRHRPGCRPTVRGRVPRARVGAIGEFFDRELRPSGAVRVWGTYGPGRSLRLRIRGTLSAGQRQRTRNFLMEILH